LNRGKKRGVRGGKERGRLSREGKRGSWGTKKRREVKEILTMTSFSMCGTLNPPN